ncbi:hypothetical protein KIN20_012480 [Parelaphostrongylus tenuis]|uniref:Uncharacterized protein n=1 Tax=Parelaphostrongylus tenuis TaxID=148309 RepID=A0AAD5MW98_PARTN|nr:hypothetical protein KIN20_012480 [Parelaphostrongylus tenuis]
MHLACLESDRENGSLTDVHLSHSSTSGTACEINYTPISIPPTVATAGRSAIRMGGPDAVFVSLNTLHFITLLCT